MKALPEQTTLLLWPVMPCLCPFWSTGHVDVDNCLSVLILSKGANSRWLQIWSWYVSVNKHFYRSFWRHDWAQNQVLYLVGRLALLLCFGICDSAILRTTVFGPLLHWCFQGEKIQNTTRYTKNIKNVLFYSQP